MSSQAVLALAAAGVTAIAVPVEPAPAPADADQGVAVGQEAVAGQEDSTGEASGRAKKR